MVSRTATARRPISDSEAITKYFALPTCAWPAATYNFGPSSGVGPSFWFDRQIVARSPFRPRAVVKRLGRTAERVEREPKDRGRQPRAASGDDRRLEVDAAGGERPPKFFRRRKSSVLDHRRRWDIQRARHVTGAQAGARLRRLPQKALRGARIDHPCRAARQGCAHGGERGDAIGVLARSESTRGALDRMSFERSSFGFPSRQAAVENEYILRAEQAKRPPHPRRGIQASAVVDDDGVGVGDAKRPDVTGKLGGVRQHLMQLTGLKRERQA